jgi:signal peptidase I
LNKLQQTDLPQLSELESGLYPPPTDPSCYCKRSARGLFEWLELFVWVIGITLLIFSVFLRVAVVDGDSMQSTLHSGDTLLLCDFGYTPKKGDIIVFQVAGSDHSHPVVKRVIATEGDTVEIDFDGWTVSVNDNVIEESYVTKADTAMERGNIAFPLTVPQGCVFVLGDNRNASWDSRYSAVGCVDTRAILGKVLIRFPAHRSK